MIALAALNVQLWCRGGAQGRYAHPSGHFERAKKSLVAQQDRYLDPWKGQPHPPFTERVATVTDAAAERVGQKRGRGGTRQQIASAPIKKQVQVMLNDMWPDDTRPQRATQRPVPAEEEPGELSTVSDEDDDYDYEYEAQCRAMALACTQTQLI